MCKCSKHSIRKEKSIFSIVKAIRQAIEEEVDDFSDKEAH